MQYALAEHGATTDAQRQALYDQIEREFDAIKQKHRADLGAKDVAYIKGLRRHSRIAEALGRGLIWVS